MKPQRALGLPHSWIGTIDDHRHSSIGYVSQPQPRAGERSGNSRRPPTDVRTSKSAIVGALVRPHSQLDTEAIGYPQQRARSHRNSAVATSNHLRIGSMMDAPLR